MFSFTQIQALMVIDNGEIIDAEVWQPAVISAF